MFSRSKLLDVFCLFVPFGVSILVHVIYYFLFSLEVKHKAKKTLLLSAYIARFRVKFKINKHYVNERCTLLHYICHEINLCVCPIITHCSCKTLLLRGGKRKCFT